MLHLCRSLLLVMTIAVALPLVTAAESITTDQQAQEATMVALADLKAGDNDPQKTVAAALEFTQLLDYYKEKGNTDQVCEMQANVYWCKKRMNLESLRTYVAAKGAPAQALAARAEEIASTEVPKDQADAYFARAEAYAKDNSHAALAIAIRYFEVADRFAGTPVSLKAQRFSLDAFRKLTAPDLVGKQLQAQVSVAEDIPNDVKGMVDDLNKSMASITSKASTALAIEQKRATDILTKEAESEQAKGALDSMLALQKQISDLDATVPDLSKVGKSAIVAYHKAKDALIDKVQADLSVERGKVIPKLQKIQFGLTKAGKVDAATTTKTLIDKLAIGAAVGGGKNIDLATMKKRFGTHQVKWDKDGTLTLAYSFSDATEMKDFAIPKESKTTLEKGLLVAPGEQFQHKVSWKSFTMVCDVGLGNYGGTHLSTTSGLDISCSNYNAWSVNVKLGGQAVGSGMFDPAYTKTGDLNAMIPVEISISPERTTLKWGKVSLGKPTGPASAGKLTLCSGDGSNRFRNVVIRGKPEDSWLENGE